MNYVSTRGRAPALSFEQAMLSGLARDGGLYVPETLPQMGPDDIRALHGLPYEEIAFRVMRPFVGDTFSDETFGDLIAKAYAGFGHDARAPLVQLAPGHHLLFCLSIPAFRPWMKTSSNSSKKRLGRTARLNSSASGHYSKGLNTTYSSPPRPAFIATT